MYIDILIDFDPCNNRRVAASSLSDPRLLIPRTDIEVSWLTGFGTTLDERAG